MIYFNATLHWLQRGSWIQCTHFVFAVCVWPISEQWYPQSQKFKQCKTLDAGFPIVLGHVAQESRWRLGFCGQAIRWQVLCGLAGGAWAVCLWALIDRWVKEWTLSGESPAVWWMGMWLRSTSAYLDAAYWEKRRNLCHTNSVYAQPLFNLVHAVCFICDPLLSLS